MKVLHPHLSRDTDYVRRFEREARVAQRIDSPNVVRVFDSGSDGATHFLVMEYVEGQTLAQRISTQARLSVPETVRIAVSIANGLEAAHQVGIVHRDISPQNVILQPDGTVKVTDFGVARDLGATAMTATNMLLGKPQYIAPEVVAGGRQADIRADIYALGVVLYEMLTGQVPFNADTPWGVIRQHERAPPPALESQRPDSPHWLRDVYARCLAKRPEQRYRTPAELRGVLMQGGSQNGPPPQLRAPAGSGSYHRPVLVLLGACGGLALVVGVMIMMLLNASGEGQTVEAVSTPDDPAENVFSPSTPPPSTAIPAPTEHPTLIPTATATRLPDRSNCEEIRGTDYRSSSERQWFLENCVATPVPTAVATTIVTLNEGPVISQLVCKSGEQQASAAGTGVLYMSSANRAVTCTVVMASTYDRLRWWEGPDEQSLKTCGCGRLTESIIIDFTEPPNHVIGVIASLDGHEASLFVNLVLVD